MMHVRTQPSPRGFTLVETLVAISILMIAIVGPYYSIQQAIVTSYAARDQLIGSSLAQAGEEYIYFLRDTNYLRSLGWTDGMAACFSSYGCVVEPSDNLIGACSAQGCPALKLASNGLYMQSGVEPDTRFTRTVKIRSITTDQIEVRVTVTWTTAHRNFSVETVENLYNWL